MRSNQLFTMALSLFTSLTLSAQSNVRLAVGTYTDGGSRGIYTYSFNQQTGKATLLDSLQTDNPSFVTFSSDGRLIYCVNESGEAQSAVSAISHNLTTGRMQLLNRQSTLGADPCYVAVKGGLLLTANYTGGSLSTFPIKTDGTIGPLDQQFKGSTGGPFMPNQASAHIHTAVFAPGGRYVLASDFSNDRILRYRLMGGKLTEDGVAATMTAGSGPRHIAFSHDGRFFYVMSEVGDRVGVFSWDGSRGTAKRLEEHQADTINAHGGADIHLSPNGRFLYVSNRLQHDGITIFKVNKATGRLTKVGYQPTKRHPRNFGITPNGRFLLCAARDDNRIQVFRIDTRTGLLTDTGHDITVSRPSCVTFCK